MTERVWILGASDPEMSAIEALLNECGERVAYAVSEGRRVTPATAYRATAVQYADGCAPSDTTSDWYLVECGAPTPAGARRVIIDHHRPGDPGFGRPPSEFFPASSIGQVYMALRRHYVAWHDREGWITSDGGEPRDVGGQLIGLPYADVVPHHLVLVAAADHCLGAAYRGACPGVDPDELMRWRVEQRAAFQGRAAEQILEDIERARECLAEADTVELAPGVRVVDVRGYSLVTHDCGHKELRHKDYASHLSHKHGCPGSTEQWCNGWTEEPGIPELPDAASRDGVAYIATVADGGGRQKVVLGGRTTPETVRAFLEAWAPQQGLVDCYGDPARGFAGGYMA